MHPHVSRIINPIEEGSGTFMYRRRLLIASTGLGRKMSAWARKAVAACATDAASRMHAPFYRMRSHQ